MSDIERTEFNLPDGVDWTAYRAKVEADTKANARAIDSLLNFETVKYFGAERREAERYDNAMAGYEDAAIRTALVLRDLRG